MAPSAESPIEDLPPILDSANDSEGDIISIGGVVYITVMLTLLTFVFMMIFIKCASLGQKTRNPQQRRMYAGSRARPSLSTHEPTIYVSPSNLPPPPKYECMAPPSYEEVVGVHYPNLQAQQPIAQPITNALAQSTQQNIATQDNSTRTNDSAPTTNDSVAVADGSAPTPNDSITRANNTTIVVTVNERQPVMSS